LKANGGSPIAPKSLSPGRAWISPLLSRLTALARSNDHVIALGLLLICIVTRFIAIPASLWEWDDILFARALHKYDLIAHSPHPPGFPVFVAMARAAYWIIGDEHRALTAVSFIFASMIAPALFYFYRVVLEDRRIAFAGALLGSFAPNVWVHGGAGRSDGVAFTLGIIGLTLVIRGLQSQRSLIIGCAVFGLAMGVRTTLLPVMGPVIALVFLVRLWRREWRGVITALAVGTLCVMVWYVPMVYHVTWPVYRSAVDNHLSYFLGTDTIFVETKSLKLLFYRVRRFFEHMWGARWIMYLVYVFSITGLVTLAVKRQRKTIGLMAIAFLPYLIFTFVLNTRLSGPLYALPYVPLFTGLAACGLIMAPRRLFRAGRWKALGNSGLFLAVCLTMVIAGWTYPIVNLLHREVSPPVRALDHLKKSLDPENDLLFYDPLFSPHVSLYLPNQQAIPYEKDLYPWTNLIWSVPDHKRIVALTSDPILGMDGEHFIWTFSELGARRLSKPSLERYSGAHVAELSKPLGIAFLSGWYPVEIDQRESWQWMQPRGKVALYRLAESMTLRLRGAIVDPPNPDRRPTLIFRLNGEEVDRFTFIGSEIDHQLTVRPNPSLAWSILSLEIDQRVIRRDRSNRSTRELGLKCFSIEWTPAPGASIINSSPDQYLGSGWHELESGGFNHWRWTSGSTVARLPAIEGDGRLDLKMVVPSQSDESKREMKVELGGKVLEQVRPRNGYFRKTYDVPQSQHRSAELELKLSLPNDESRSAGIQVYYLGWRPSEKN
jgi:Dolichyl-phosphate-mannose-protein mannosyltransferase